MRKQTRSGKPLRRLVGAAVVLSVAVCALLALAAMPLTAAENAAAENAAGVYLRALLTGQAATVMRMTPTKPENKFGPCPFDEMPRLEKPRVDAHRGAVMFKGRARDPELPSEGGVILTKLDHVKGNPWRVRQVAFFVKPPLGARIPPHSITRKDAVEEPRVVEAARRYIASWLKGDYRVMENLTFDWVARIAERQPVTIRSIEFNGQPSEGGELKIDFTARITLYYALPKTVQGTVFAMRENGEWRIRANQLMF